MDERKAEGLESEDGFDKCETSLTTRTLLLVPSVPDSAVICRIARGLGQDIRVSCQGGSKRLRGEEMGRLWRAEPPPMSAEGVAAPKGEISDVGRGAALSAQEHQI